MTKHSKKLLAVGPSRSPISPSRPPLDYFSIRGKIIHETQRLLSNGTGNHPRDSKKTQELNDGIIYKFRQQLHHLPPIKEMITRTVSAIKFKCGNCCEFSGVSAFVISRLASASPEFQKSGITISTIEFMNSNIDHEVLRLQVGSMDMLIDSWEGETYPWANRHQKLRKLANKHQLWLPLTSLKRYVSQGRFHVIGTTHLRLSGSQLLWFANEVTSGLRDL